MIRNSLSDFKSDTQKLTAFLRDRGKKSETIFAYKSDGSRVPLRDLCIKKVEHVGGAWRIQEEFPYEIENVRKKDFVIGNKFPHTERTGFVFYEAYSVSENCYGKYRVSQPDYIVAKMETVRGTFSAYGKTIADVRAYLGIKLWDAFPDVIRNAINSQKLK